MATVVISYARVDQPLVRAVVKLLRAAMREFEDPVYWDEDFEPGDAWLDQIKRSIDAAPQVFVFWCAHSARSRQVAEEFRYALTAGKRVVPVLLDSTELSPELAPIHGVDLREAVRHAVLAQQDVVPAPMPSPTPGPAARPAPDDVDCGPVPRGRPGLRGGGPTWAAGVAVGLLAVGAVAVAATSQSAGYVIVAAAIGIAALAAAVLITRGRSMDTPSLPPLAQPAPSSTQPLPRAADDTRRHDDALRSIDTDAVLAAFRRNLAATDDAPD